MAGKIPKFTLSKNDKGKWALKDDAKDRTVRLFDTKAEATKGGVLEKAVGSAGGSVKIQKENGRIQEERTYPRSEDPSKSKG